MEKMNDKALQVKRNYLNAWRKNNPDKVRQHANDYWERKAASYSIVDRVKELKEAGHTEREIPARLNISLGAVNKYINQP